MPSFAELLGTLSNNDQTRGREFEHLCRWFLLNDPVYHALVKRVWLWREWPGCWGSDAGIDLVVEARDGGLWAVQAKAYDPAYSITKSDIDKWLSESARRQFSYRLLIATTDRVAPLAERVMRAQEKKVGQRLLHDLERAEVAWPSSIADLRPARPEPNRPRDHQREAIDAVLKGLADADRGQLIMACGTGKTLVALWLREALAAERTLVLVPSLSLLGQTIDEWLLNANQDFEFLPVCSDDTVREHDQMVSSVGELGFPATGSPQKVRAFLRGRGPRVVFSTYQSSPVVAEAMKGRIPPFDLALADEAHRCAGPTTSDFATILDPKQIRATKRLFMTATPRYFTGRIRKAGVEADFEIASMDDDQRFGAVLHRLTFAQAIKDKLLSDYRVLVIGVDNQMYRDYAERGRFVTRDGKKVTDARSLAAQIGLAKAMKKYDLRRTITFHGRVNGAKDFAESLPGVIAWMPKEERPDGAVWADYASGAMNAFQRRILLRRLLHVATGHRGVLANARCLAEGVDVPTLDGVAFIDPKRSEVDIAQAVGRAIRKAEHKTLGTIVIPVFVEPGADAEATVEASAFKPVWDVVRALRDHDAQLGAALDELRRALGRRASASVQIPEKIVVEMPVGVGADFVRAFETCLIESTTAGWEFWYGLLERFVEREGHCQVPQSHVEDDGFRLGTWVNNQRHLKRTGKLDLDKVHRLESINEWTWYPRADAWEEGFEHLLRFVERKGHARVPSHHVEGRYRLGRWVVKQRTAYSRRTLTEERVRRLEAIEGWSWYPHDEAWEEGFDHLKRYVARKGHARVPVNHVEGPNRFKLGQWVAVQRRLNNKGKLTSERVERLGAVEGWTWDGRAAAWEEVFQHLLRHVAREGHADVPSSHVEGDCNLGWWVANQRQFYARGKLSPERVERLEAIEGWVWDTRAAASEEAFQHLSRYVAREGHARVPQQHVEGPKGFKLGGWVGGQRADYAEGKLDPERIRRLEAIEGWVWDTRAAAWEEAFQHLLRFVEREGTARVLVEHVEGPKRFRLGQWVAVQRRLNNKGKLDPERAARLDARPGWTWDARGGGEARRRGSGA